MKKISILLLLINIVVFGNGAEKALAFYNSGKFQEAAQIAQTLDESSALNLYVKAITEKTGNEAASLYRKALVANGITSKLSTKIYKRLAQYYESIGMPGSVSVMLERAAEGIVSIVDPDATVDSVKITEVENKDTVVVEKVLEEKNSSEDTVDFASADDTKEITPKVVPKSEVKPKSVNTPSVPKVFYTLQTGAFGLEDNALKMKSSLEKNFKNVSIKMMKSGDRTLHKVRVGRFTSQQEALSFAAAKLRPKKIKFRIVKE